MKMICIIFELKLIIAAYVYVTFNGYVVGNVHVF